MTSFKTYLALVLAPAALGVVTLPGCATAPQSQEAKQNLSEESHSTFDEMNRADPSLDGFIKSGYAYAVFPSIGKGGIGIAAGFGRGEVYEQNKFIGYTDVSVGTVGATLGGETFSELLVFQDKTALDNFTNNKLQFDASATAVGLKSGAAATAKFDKGVAVFTHAHGGLMVDASVGGQQFTFRSAETENE